MPWLDNASTASHEVRPIHPAPARLATVSNIADLNAVSTNDAAFDGLTVVEGNRVLLVAQTDQSENGLYSVQSVSAGTTSLVRSPDANTSGDYKSGLLYSVGSEGTANANKVYILATDDSITLGSSNLVFNEFTDINVAISPNSSSRNVIQPTGDYKALIIKGNASQTANLLEFQNSSGTVKSVVDYNGSLAVGKSSVAQWNSTSYATMQVGANLIAFSNSGATAGIAHNLYHDGTNYKYSRTDKSCLIATSGGFFSVYTAASGLAGADATITQQFRIDNDGYVIVGSSTNTLGRVSIYNSLGANKALVIRGASSQTGNLTEWQNDSGTALSAINSAGRFTNFAKFPLAIACGDETTALTTGTAKVTYYMPMSMTVTEVHACLTTAGSTSTVVDVNKGASTALNAAITLSGSSNTASTSTFTGGASSVSFAAGDKLTIDIDTAGTSAAGLKITLIGY